MGHYFDADPATTSKTTTIDVTLADLAFTMTTDRGVFSHGKLDTGTALLLNQAPPPPATGHLADIGCGTGAIALTLAQRSPQATVWAIDVNQRARELTHANAERLGLTNITVAAPDDVPDTVTFSAIWSNPPIRIGKSALHELLTTWLTRLDGTAILVVQKHLGSDSLQRWLISQGYPTDRLTSRAGYRLFEVTAAR